MKWNSWLSQVSRRSRFELVCIHIIHITYIKMLLLFSSNQSCGKMFSKPWYPIHPFHYDLGFRLLTLHPMLQLSCAPQGHLGPSVWYGNSHRPWRWRRQTAERLAGFQKQQTTWFPKMDTKQTNRIGCDWCLLRMLRLLGLLWCSFFLGGGEGAGFAGIWCWLMFCCLFRDFWFVLLSGRLIRKGANIYSWCHLLWQQHIYKLKI